MLVRSPRIAYGRLDLNIFDFDYDLTWMAFFLNADGKVYGRYGGRDGTSATSRLSLQGLRYAMSAALAKHRQQGGGNTGGTARSPFFAENIPGITQFKTDSCVHCHQIYGARRANLVKAGKWTNDMFWVYPLPENVGLTLDNNQGNLVRAVAANSAASRAGFKVGDFVQTLNGTSVASFGDAQYALHYSPSKGTIPVSVLRDGKTLTGNLELADGWRKTDLSWRPSLRNRK